MLPGHPTVIQLGPSASLLGLIGRCGRLEVFQSPRACCLASPSNKGLDPFQGLRHPTCLCLVCLNRVPRIDLSQTSYDLPPFNIHAIMSASLPADIVKSSGPLILGYILNWGLFGVVSIQVYYYYIAFPRDRLYCKCLVYGVYILETLQTVVITHDAFASFGVGFGSFEALDNIQYTCLSIPILSGIVGCVVQVFYAYRINLLSRSRVIGYAIATISVVGCIAGIVTGAKSFEIGRLSKLTQTTVFISAGFWWGCCALCDVTIAVVMTYLLSRHDTGFRSTHLMITRLTRLTIETGTATALVAVINLFLFFRYPDTNYYTVPVLIIAKLYCNTLLVLFNSRMRIAGGREDAPPSTTTFDLSTRPAAITFSRPPSAYLQDWRIHFRKDEPADEGGAATEGTSSGQGVRVTTNVYVDSDAIGKQTKPRVLAEDHQVV
ncbi:hypothetical protein LshimejAT787_0703270 [Lyophyllum shimeji]|uniref:DUF6534 domain-containing protein n=1 Tax=Lyophyllum shimeji TaxID=47721 RepID=A0A9P3PNR7_LYOSH|nr:hypothetical protein LshimejAT787_0703270 [Lyophyllum shimeji]